MYDHTKQYRCDIIRGKAQKKMDDYLPAYAKIIDDICPCKKSEFDEAFNKAFSDYIPLNSTKKTFDNHRTETAGTLFGMYYESADGFVYTSERTLKYLSDDDQPAFFKDVCFKMQFPNGMTGLQKLTERIALRINIRPNSYVIKTLIYARNAGIVLTKSNIGYYVLNSLDVLQGNANPNEVIDQIVKDKDSRIERKVHEEGKESSWNMQHINEQINYLEYANLVITDGEEVSLNPNEKQAINMFADLWNEKPTFDVYAYKLNTKQGRDEFRYDWDYYYARISDNSDAFTTTVASLGIPKEKQPSTTKTKGDLIELGDEGELYVYNFEKQRVGSFNTRLANKVLHLGKTKGLGYDIQSVIAEEGDMAEFVKYIEVKSTKRVTEPDVTDTMWVDTINITRNEWIAAQQHKGSYSIFRVYFVRGSVIMYIMENVYQKEKDGLLKIVPMTYRVDFNNSAIDAVVS